jgi:hypothetical protein
MRRHHDRNWSGPALIFAASDVKRFRFVGTGDVAIRKPKRRTVFASFSVTRLRFWQVARGYDWNHLAGVRIHFAEIGQDPFHKHDRLLPRLTIHGSVCEARAPSRAL